MIKINIRVTYEDDEGYIKISPMMTFRVPINKVQFYDNYIAIFNEETGDYLPYSKDRIVYLNIERSNE